MNEEKQTEMELPYTYSVEKMGFVVDPQSFPHTIHLSKLFIRDELGASMFDGKPGWEKEEVTNIGCPFCKKGRLKLIKVERVYSDDLSPTRGETKHIGNDYEYVCSNDECDGRFFGTYEWKRRTTSGSSARRRD